MSLDTKNFDIGERVKIVKPRREGIYSNGYSLRQIPLGTCGVITHYDSGRLCVSINGQEYGFMPEELSYAEKPQFNSKENNFLESLLDAEEPIEKLDEKEPINNKNLKTCKGFNGFIQKFRNFLGYKHKQKTLENSTRQNSFEPKFNVREEFALWIREQFPEIEKYAENGGNCPELIKRKNEVYNAAKKACEHGIETTYSCVSEQFGFFLRDLGKCKNNKFDDIIFSLINFIEYVSANLNNGVRSRHYGSRMEVRIQNDR